MLTIAVILIPLVLFMMILGSRNNDRHGSDGYHDDPYYYYPRNAPPRYAGGYQQPYYPQPYQQYQQPFQPPYPQPYQPLYVPHSVRPGESGNSLVTGMVMFMLLAIFAFTLATKMGVLSGSITIGIPQKESQGRNIQPVSIGDGYIVSAKNKPK